METAGENRKFGFYGEGGTLFGIHIVNLFLGLITLGIYFFWGRVKIRKYIWGQIDIDGDRLSYHGTAQEIIRGWVKAVLIFGIPYVLLQNGPKWAGLSKVVIGLGALGSVILLLFFIPMAVVGTRRYRLSRTAWRGIRLSFREHWKGYFPIFFLGGLLKVVTLSLYTPFYDARRDKFLISNSYLGNLHFDYDGNGEDLFPSYLLALFLFVPTLGLSFLWYHVKKTRYMWDHTTLGGARFSCTQTFGGFFGLMFGNFWLVLLTLGFGFPWAQVRAIRYFLDNLTLNGPVDFESVMQDAQQVDATGEELSSFLDLDFDLG